jgi:hemoglobin
VPSRARVIGVGLDGSGVGEELSVDGVGDPSLQAPDGFHPGLAGAELAPVGAAAFGAEPGLGGRGDEVTLHGACRDRRLFGSKVHCSVGVVTTLYEHAGGEEGLHRLEELFYAKVLADPLLHPLFGAGQPDHVEHLTWFTAESFGGPDRFSRELGFAHLINVHRGLHISEEQLARFVELYLLALDESGLPVDEPFRHAVREHIEFGSQVAFQNSNATSEQDLHPLREVPRWTWSGDERSSPGSS